MTQVTNISSVGLIYRSFNPAEVFLEIKDDGHPIKLVRRQLCPIGGNWIGEAAKRDSNPNDTFVRELGEELSFERSIRDSVDLALLGVAELEKFAPAPAPNVGVDTEDIEDLEDLKWVMGMQATVLADDYLHTVSKDALDAADPENKRDGFTTLTSYWSVPLAEKDWRRLVRLQEKFGNLSGESITLITSLDEIVKTDTRIAFGHDRVLQRFWLERGFAKAANLILVPGITSVSAGHRSLSSYRYYLARYDVAKKPI